MSTTTMSYLLVPVDSLDKRPVPKQPDDFVFRVQGSCISWAIMTHNQLAEAGWHFDSPWQTLKISAHFCAKLVGPPTHQLWKVTYDSSALPDDLCFLWEVLLLAHGGVRTNNVCESLPDQLVELLAQKACLLETWRRNNSTWYAQFMNFLQSSVWFAKPEEDWELG